MSVSLGDWIKSEAKKILGDRATEKMLADVDLVFRSRLVQEVVDELIRKAMPIIQTLKSPEELEAEAKAAAEKAAADAAAKVAELAKAHETAAAAHSAAVAKLAEVKA